MNVYVENVIAVVMMIILSVEDVRNKSLSVSTLLIMFAAAVSYRFLCVVFSVERVTYGGMFIVGVAFLVILTCISLFTKSIGMGDVIVLGIIAVLRGSSFAMATFFCGMTILFFTVAVKLILGKIKRKTTIALVPYLGLGMIAVIMCS